MKYSAMTLMPLLCSFFVVSACPLRAQDGVLDPTFDGDGRVTTTLGVFDDVAQAIGLQEDGKIVVAGKTYLVDRYAFFVARYLPNGTLDPSFGLDGVTVTPIGTGNALAHSLAIQPNGAIVVCGVSTVDGREMMSLARYVAKTGQLDPSFGDGGIVVTPVGSGWSSGRGVAIQPNGTIVAVGYAQVGSDAHFAIVRYDRFGVPDPTFGEAGVVTTSFGPGTDIANAVYVINDDAILVVGTSEPNGVNADAVLARYKGSGALDGAFGVNGMKRIERTGTFDEYGNAVVVTPEGSIVIATSSNNRFEDLVAIRLAPDGTPDPGFGLGGVASTDIGPIVEVGEASSVLVQPDGKVVTSGLRTSGSEVSFGLVRYNINGTIDETFGDSGTITTRFGSSSDEIFASILQPDGKILVAGGSHDGTQSRIALARYNNPSVSGPSTVHDSHERTIVVSPNPATTLVKVQLKSPLANPEIKLLDLMGERGQVHTTIDGVLVTVNTTNLAPGTYLLHIADADGIVATSPVVIVR
ncbi:MAG: T9SS type A sorting domain-containing protein [Ignavibacteria bacterium]|nr:T9SS type A sorting domain-containing protein [Ignavibacteria bacterium]